MVQAGQGGENERYESYPPLLATPFFLLRICPGICLDYHFISFYSFYIYIILRGWLISGCSDFKRKASFQ